MAQFEEVWWLNGGALDCCPAVPGSNPASPQPTADCQSPGGLPPGMALACELISVRGDRGKNYENTKKHKKNKKYCRYSTVQYIHTVHVYRVFSTIHTDVSAATCVATVSALH